MPARSGTDCCVFRLHVDDQHILSNVAVLIRGLNPLFCMCVVQTISRLSIESWTILIFFNMLLFMWIIRSKLD